MSIVKLKASGILSIEESGFHGGRVKRDGDGFVRIEFVPLCLTGCNEVTICTEDNMSSEDGEYSPASLSIKQLVTLKGWIEQQLASSEAVAAQTGEL